MPTLTLDASPSEVHAESPLPGATLREGALDGPALAASQAASEVDAHAISRELDDERRKRRAAEAAQAEAMQKLEVLVREYDEERQRRAAAEHAHTQAVQELVARTDELADARRRHQALEHEQAAAMLALALAKQVAEALPAELAAQVEARERSATEAHMAMRMLRKTMEILVRHATDDVVADWKRQIVAVLVEGAELGPDVLAATRFAEQFIGAFRSADALPEDGPKKPKATPTEAPVAVEPMSHLSALSVDPRIDSGTADEVGAAQTRSDAALPTVTPLLDQPAATGDFEPDTVTVTRIDRESSDTSELPSAAPPSSGRAPPPSPRRVRQWSKWRPLDPVDVVSKTPPAEPKVGRNDPCSCGSGKKFKRCCWRS